MTSQASSSRINPQARILIMDDDPHVRSITRKILEKLGYPVETAVDGTEAVQAYTRSMETNAPFGLVIMDLTVPGGIGGKEAAGQILAIDPGAVMVVASGYANDPIMADYKSYGFKGVILKPFRMADLEKTAADFTGTPFSAH